ncbi:MAG: N-acetylmuramoyl-L-alanine amidase CwlD [Eubacterium sp.]|nr:N-acetylmuramoyl-L-alanine amidase CwlD [Eubacterium sp.]MCI8917937.1 N-acetylmuramoyl-L-alanine amidase CwlD [Eubacterium sp.]
MKQRLELIMSVVILICACILAKTSAVYVTGHQVKEPSDCIMIDVGHGGFDSGKVGVNGELEKDINLQIALKLKKTLEDQGMSVIMTREEDKGLYDEGASNKKAQDLQRRCDLINEKKPLMTISIHQNSYTSPQIKGAQVFYYTTSAESQKLAEIIQKTLIEQVDPDNHREAKPNDSYYMLKRTSSVIVIVECGFLSNPEEAAKLTDEEYQQKLVEAICQGAFQYMEKDLKK